MDLYGSLFAVPIPLFQIRLSTRMNKCQMLWWVNSKRLAPHPTRRFAGCLGASLASMDSAVVLSAPTVILTTIPARKSWAGIGTPSKVTLVSEVILNV